MKTNVALSGMLVLSVALLGCSSDSVPPADVQPAAASGVEPIASHDEATAVIETAEADQEQPAGPTKDQVTRLFQTTWKANHKKTIASELNAGFDKQELQEVSWLYCIQWERMAFFKDAGINWRDRSNEWFLEDLPANGPDFGKRVRVIDNDHWAYLTANNVWIVMDEVE